MAHLVVGTWVAYNVEPAMFITALRIAAIVSRIIILDTPVLALAIADRQSSIIPKVHPVLRLASTVLLDQTKHRVDYINRPHLTAEAMRVNTRVRRMIVGDSGRVMIELIRPSYIFACMV